MRSSNGVRMSAFTSDGLEQLQGQHHLQTLAIRRRIEFLTRHHMLSCREALLRLQAAGFSASGALREVRAQRSLFYVQLIDVACFPSFQWRHVQLRVGIAGVLEAFAGRHTKWHIAMWFASENDLLDGLRPIDLLDVEPRSVVRAAALDAGVRAVSH
jgi:hypothetical protein